jgi:hypothetical protein
MRGVAVEERVPWVSFSFGLRPELVTRAGAGAGAPEGRSNHFALEANGEIQVFDVWESRRHSGRRSFRTWPNSEPIRASRWSPGATT